MAIDVPTPEEISSWSKEQTMEFVKQVHEEYGITTGPLCPMSGMGRDTTEWSECRGGRCAWYRDATWETDSGRVLGMKGCAMRFMGSDD